MIPIDEVGTDRNRLDTWTQAAADQANAAVDKLGIKRVGLIKTNGYQAVPLDGIWLRAPYFHNGSVPNLREVLEPEANRSKIFYRGYDVYDPANMGFDTQSAEAQTHGFKIDTSVKGNGNQGHLYGTTLPAADKTGLDRVHEDHRTSRRRTMRIIWRSAFLILSADGGVRGERHVSGRSVRRSEAYSPAKRRLQNLV